MDDIKWIKLAIDVFDNRKIKQIEVLPDGDTLIVIWFKLLALAGQINDKGFVYFSQDLPYTDQMLATQFRRPLATVQMALQIFEQYGMINIVDDVLKVSNWERYQNVDGMELVRDQTRERVRRFRERQKTLQIEPPKEDCVTSNATVTHGNALDIDKDIEEDIDNTIVHLNASFEALWDLYPKKQGKKQALAAYIRDRKKGFTDEQMRSGMEAYLEHIKRDKIGFEFVKMGSTFFSQRAWDDDWSGGTQKQETSGGRSDLDDMKRFLESMEG